MYSHSSASCSRYSRSASLAAFLVASRSSRASMKRSSFAVSCASSMGLLHVVLGHHGADDPALAGVHGSDLTDVDGVLDLVDVHRQRVALADAVVAVLGLVVGGRLHVAAGEVRGVRTRERDALAHGLDRAD